MLLLWLSFDDDAAATAQTMAEWSPVVPGPREQTYRVVAF